MFNWNFIASKHSKNNVQTKASVPFQISTVYEPKNQVETPVGIQASSPRRDSNLGLTQVNSRNENNFKFPFYTSVTSQVCSDAVVLCLVFFHSNDLSFSTCLFLCFLFFSVLEAQTNRWTSKVWLECREPWCRIWAALNNQIVLFVTVVTVIHRHSPIGNFKELWAEVLLCEIPKYSS